VKLALAFALVCVNGSAFADPVDLTAPEIEVLLSGRTAIGEWKGRAYRQYFNADGSTIFAMRRSQSTLGAWRVNSDTNRYESKWEDPEWESYTIVREDDTLYWTDEGLEPQAFTMVDGADLLWPEQKKK